MIVKCPKCKKEIEYSVKNPSRPFCSQRCKLIDLGAWADEKFRVPTEETSAPSEEELMQAAIHAEQEDEHH